MSRFKSIVVAACVFSLPAAGLAQTSASDAQGAARSAARDPGDATAAVPAVTYASAFARYRPNADVEVGNWRDRNDAVGRIGGWRIYGREASAPDQTADKAVDAAQAPAKADMPKPPGLDTKPPHGHAR